MSENRQASKGRPLFLLLREFSRVLLWGEAWAGHIELRGETPVFRVAVWLGLLLAAGLSCLVPWVGQLRGAGPLLSLPMATGERTMPTVPLPAVPLAYGLLALAWAYILTGAARASWGIRALVLIPFAAFSLTLASRSDLADPAAWPWTLLSWSASLLLLLWVGIGPGLYRRWDSLAVHFVLITLLCAGALLGGYLSAELPGRGVDVMGRSAAVRLGSNLSLLASLVVPFFLLSGSAVAGIALELGQIGSRWLEASIKPVLWKGALGLFLLLRTAWLWLWPLGIGQPRPLRWGAVALVGCLLAVFWALHRWRHRRETEPIWGNLLPVLLLAGPLPLFQLFLAAVILVALLLPASGTWVGHFALFLEQVGTAFLRFGQNYTWAVGGGLILAGIFLWRRFPRGAFSLLCLGFWMVLWKATRPLNLLGAAAFDLEDFTAIGTLVLAGLFLLALLRRRLTPAVLFGLGVSALTFWFLEGYPLLSAPLSPLNSLPGVGNFFLAVSMLLSLLSQGVPFGVNRGTPGFPRESRALLFLGYGLLSVLLASWSILTRQGKYEGYAEVGFLLIGLPLCLAGLLTVSPDTERQRVNDA